MTLPPLPEPGYWSTRDDDTPLFTSDQMRDYARAALAAVPAQPVAWLGGDGHPHHISAMQTITERRIHGPWQPLYAAPQAVPVPAWQPIETVPAFPFVQEKWFKTGPRYLLAERSRVFIGSYSYTERGKGRWQDLVSKNCEPTHWMPLPAAPKEQPHE